MRTRFLRGSTDENNGLTLPEGEISIDEERKAVRLHDGQTLGGFELVGTQVVDSGPGATTLVAGDSTAGFYGEVASSDLIDGNGLASLVGLSAGISQYSTIGWLKFAYQDKIVYVAKKPIRYYLSWEALYNLGLVYGTDDYGIVPLSTPVNQYTTVTIDTHTYVVRLMKLFDEDPVIDATIGGDVTALLGGLVNDWGLYTEDEITVPGTANGDAPWAQETPDSNTNNRYLNTSGRIDSFTTKGSTYATSYAGWRPVLELVE